MGSNIEVDTKWADVARILPRINEEVNEEWLSDKSRYAWDGLKYQRLAYPMIKNIKGDLEETGWIEAFEFIKKKINSMPNIDIAGSIGPFQDVESIVAYRDFMHKMGSEDLEFLRRSLNIDNTFRNQYLMNSRIRGIEDADALLIVGANLRNECPVLNARIRKAVQKGLKVGIIGPANNTFYNYIHLGNHPSSIEAILNPANEFNKLLKKSKFPMILLGTSIIDRADGQSIYNNIIKLCQICNVIKQKEKWNGLNILHRHSSTSAMLDIGIRYRARAIPPNVVYLLGSDEFELGDIPKDSFVIYQGHTGDKGAARADVILPGCSYLEKNATYVNTEGRVQYGRKVMF